MINHLLSVGNLEQINQELYMRVWSTFAALPTFRLSRATTEYELPTAEISRLPYGRSHKSRKSLLNFFKTQRDQSVRQLSRISIQDARKLICEVKFDRDTMFSQEMADCKNRHDSFSNSQHLKGKVFAYQLAQLGFFFVGDLNAVGKLRCAFCWRTMHMFDAQEAPYLENNFEHLIIALLNRHSELSNTCFFSLGLNGDNSPFSADDISRIIDPLIITEQITIFPADISLYPHEDLNLIRSTSNSILQHFPDERVELDGEDSYRYNNLIAELCNETHTIFDHEPDLFRDLELADGLTLSDTFIDYFIGFSPKYPKLWAMEARLNTFNAASWCQHPISRTTCENLKPMSFALAGFFYTGKEDNVTCFWCGLTVNHWHPIIDPVTEHLLFSPRCTWVLRTCGRQRVKRIYITKQLALSSVQFFLPDLDSSFLRDVDDIPGGIDNEHIQLCSVYYQTEMLEVMMRLDLPANRTILDEFGYSLDFLMHAIESRLYETGDDYSSSQQLLEVLWVYENQMLERKINSDEEFVAKARRMQEQVEANSLSQLHTSTAPDVHSMASDSQAASHTTCVVCMCNPRSFTLIPCGHMAVCQSCCSRLKQCPLCRAVIRGVIRTYV